MRSRGPTFLGRDIAAMERLAEARMPKRIAVRRIISADDGSGGTIDTPTEVATIPCALTRMQEPRELTIGEGARGIADWRLLVPNGSDIQPTDELLPWWLWDVRLGLPTAGTFSLTYRGHTTAGIAYNATAATLLTRFDRLASVGAGNALVSGAMGGPWRIHLIHRRAANEHAITASFAGLTGGDGLIERPAFQVIGVEDVATDAPQMTVYLTRRS